MGQGWPTFNITRVDLSMEVMHAQPTIVDLQ